ncbi:phage major capsid protein [Trueperella pyogenes]|uniref:Phage major capsid protein n=1 Tax=Trueperella pyogenes TaxID=1661 RepID=A0A3Q9GF91_9ACTO|nr:phage major capsid protein [Trueperella pyogenes]AZR06369.1 phage major capsid protein [Trueperella pyogenes]QIU87080.1 phage major capsid protein [Trueperella pyogenes]
MALINTEGVKAFLPRKVADGMIKETQSLSTVARLSGREPMKFGNVDYIMFSERPRAEFVEEGADKASSNAVFKTVTAKPHKAQVTLRFNEEVLWADEDYQLGVLRELGTAGSEALSRALDLGIYHAINPLTGQKAAGIDGQIALTDHSVELGVGDVDAALRTAAGNVITANFDVNGVAIDPSLTFKLAELKDKDGRQRYPQLGLGANIDSFMGLSFAQGNTVSGRPEIQEDSKIRAIVGDFRNGIRWGIQRQIPLEVIRFGDPDGSGDLKRKNQIALRLEIVYGWYAHKERFAVVKEG